MKPKQIIPLLSWFSIVIVTLSMILATFVEKFEGTHLALQLIYASYWFSAIWALIGAVVFYKISLLKYRKRFLFITIHFSLICIIAGYLLSGLTSKKGYITMQKGIEYSVVVLQDEKTLTKELMALPFLLTLDDYLLENYVGSEMPSAYTSYIRLRDTASDAEQVYTVQMNSPLSFRGYKFYQSTFDTENDTVQLMFSFDKYGTPVVYAGYFLLVCGLMFSFVSRKSRVRQLMRHPLLKQSVLSLILFLSLALFKPMQLRSQPEPLADEYARMFGQLWVQDGKGRIKPMNTLSIELIQKITGKEEFSGMSPEQFVMSIMTKPAEWADVAFIKLKNSQIADIIGADGGYASYNSFFNADRTYKLDSLLGIANAMGKQANAAEKEAQAVTERLNVFLQASKLHFLKVFPHPDDPQKAWYSPDADLSALPAIDSLFVSDVFALFFESCYSGKAKQAFDVISSVAKYQQKHASAVLPPHEKRKAEILYNRAGVFPKLFKLYAILGLSFLLVYFIGLIQSRPFRWFSRGLLFAMILLVIVHTFFLGLRAYIAGHAPISNGYEIMLFISWVSAVGGLVLHAKSKMLTAASYLFASLALLVAQFSWMNPEITALVPVLKSNWLSIHVSIIMLSYAFAGVAALMGFLNTCLVIFARKSFADAAVQAVRKIGVSIELLVWFCVYSLAIGIIMGSVWANESWGDYWSWDAKEVWALISAIIYAALAHFSKKLQPLLLSFFTVLAFLSILVTYFGVNYYFGGMHSYAGDGTSGVLVYFIWGISAFFVLWLLAEKKRLVLMKK